MMELSKTQEMAYKKLLEKGPCSSYSLGFSLNTLKSLVKKGYATSSAGLGSMAFPRSSIEFKAIIKD